VAFRRKRPPNRLRRLTGRPPPSPRSSRHQAGVDVVVTTPGRAVALLQRGALSLTATQAVVLDEVDVLCGAPRERGVGGAAGQRAADGHGRIGAGSWAALKGMAALPRQRSRLLSRACKLGRARFLNEGAPLSGLIIPRPLPNPQAPTMLTKRRWSPCRPPRPTRRASSSSARRCRSTPLSGCGRSSPVSPMRLGLACTASRQVRRQLSLQVAQSHVPLPSAAPLKQPQEVPGTLQGA
jgi:hypothetical protein